MILEVRLEHTQCDFIESLTHRQNTNLTTRGMLREGFFVSPAVMPKLSVPPTESPVSHKAGSEHPSALTGKTSGDKHLCEATEATNKGRPGYSPVFAADISVLLVHTHIHEYAYDDEDDDRDHLER